MDGGTEHPLKFSDQLRTAKGETRAQMAHATELQARIERDKVNHLVMDRFAIFAIFQERPDAGK